MSKFYMMIGFPASGKSTYAKTLAEETGAIICSSDAYRKEMFGSEAVQDHNEEVFDKLMKDMKELLASGKDVIYDAQNISSKYRRHTINMLKKYTTEIIGILIATPYEMCLERNAARERHVPEYAIKRSYMNFNIPCLQEGFSELKIVYLEAFQFKDVSNIIEELKSIPHDNPHHSTTIGDHMTDTYNYLMLKDRDPDRALKFASLLHDIGKPFCKTFINHKGELTGNAHYYNHMNVGAYLIFFLNIPEELKFEIALLIQYHMHYYMSWKQSKKAYDNDKKFLGEEFIKKLDILHECDLVAH